MRWQNLFDDLESQLEQELDAEEEDLRVEEQRLRLGRLVLRDRIRLMLDAPEGARLSILLRDGDPIVVEVAAVGRDWVAGELEGAGSRRSVVVPVAAIGGIVASPGQLTAGLAAEPVPESPTAVSTRLGLGFVLRDLCRRRAAVDVVVGSRRLFGTIDRVGRDHLDLAEHPPGEPRRSGGSIRFVVLPLDDIRLVRF